jgi:hypothetical protein
MYFFQPAPPPSPKVASNAIAAVQQRTEPSKTAPSVQQPNESLRARTFYLKNDLLSLEVNGLGSIIDARLLQFHQTIDSSKETIHYHYDNSGFNTNSVFIEGQTPSWRLI